MSSAGLPDFRSGWYDNPAYTGGMPDDEDRPSPGAKTVEEQARLGRTGKGKKQNRVKCPKCEDSFGNLPLHLAGCDGGAD
jgi:hypothetical protein